MKLTSGVKRKIRQEQALARRKQNIEQYTDFISNFGKQTTKFCTFLNEHLTIKQAKHKLNLAEREVAILKQKLGAW